MARDDVPDIERPQPFHRIGDDPFHDAAKVQPAHDAIDGNVWIKAADVGADINDSGMRARAEDNQSQMPDMGHERALIHKEGIWFPSGIGTSSAKVIDAAFLKTAHARDLATVIKVSVEQQSFFGIVDHRRPNASISDGVGTFATGTMVPFFSLTAR